MPGTGVAVVGKAPLEGAAAASSSGELRFEPGTRLVVDTANLPSSAAGIDAKWYTSVTSRASGASVEIAELYCIIDLRGNVTAADSGALNNAIGVAATESTLGQLTTANSGTVLGGLMECLEVPSVGTLDIDLVMDATATIKGAEDTSGSANLVVASGNWAAGTIKAINADNITAGEYLYLSTGAASGGTANYGQGKFKLTFICQYAVPPGGF